MYNHRQKCFHPCIKQSDKAKWIVNFYFYCHMIVSLFFIFLIQALFHGVREHKN